MNLSAPTQPIFIVALVIAVIALLAALNVVTFIPVAAFWIMTVALAILAVGCLLRRV